LLSGSAAGSNGNDGPASPPTRGYVDAVVSLFHVADLALHWEDGQMLTLLVKKHGLVEAGLQVCLAMLRQKSVHTHNNPQEQLTALHGAGPQEQLRAPAERAGALSVRAVPADNAAGSDPAFAEQPGSARRQLCQADLSPHFSRASRRSGGRSLSE